MSGKLSLIALLFAGTLCIMPVFADETAEDPLWNLEQPNSPNSTFNSPQGNPYGYAPQYAPYPPVMTIPQAQPNEKRPWYKRVFSPLAKKASLPILQPPKVSKPEPRETQVLRDPLVRLAKGIAHDGQQVDPGFYLMSLQKDNGTYLTLQRQQRQVFKVPAVAGKAIGPQSARASEPLPAAPDKSKSGDKAKTDPATVEEASAHIELADNGQSMVLVYRMKDIEYKSKPVAVLNSFQP